MKKLLLTGLTLTLVTQQMHAMENFMHIPLTMEESEARAMKKQAKIYSEFKKSCAKDCVCAAKACCFACALCGLLTAPAVAAPVRAKPSWIRIAGEGIPTTVKVEQTYYNGMASTESGQIELPCFANSRTNAFHCTYSVLETLKFYEDNWPSDEDYSTGSGRADLVREKTKED